MAFEGGFVHDPDDPGGRTDRGISERAHPDAWADDVISDEEVERIYRDRYWDPLHCDALPWPLCLALFDFAVNSGVKTAAATIQRIVGTTPDGQIGPATLKAISTSPHSTISLALLVCSERTAFLLSLISRKPPRAKYRRGWLRRVASLAKVAIESA
jgi:lysozyme family protein